MAKYNQSLLHRFVQTLKHTTNSLLGNCYFTNGTVISTFRQMIGKPMGSN